MALHLISRRPSPTTASFTVSNASRHTSTAAKLFFYFQFLVRAIVFAGVLFYYSARFRRVFFIQDGSFVPWTAVWSSPLGSFVCRIADTYNFPCIAAASAIVIYAVFRKGYTGLSLTGAVLSPPLLIFYNRGIPLGYPRSRHPNFHVLPHVSIESCDKVHSND